MHCSFPKTFSVFPGTIYLGISPGTMCLEYFITPAQLKVLGVLWDCPRNRSMGGNGCLNGKESHFLVLPLSILGRCSTVSWDNSSLWLVGYEHPSGVSYLIFPAWSFLGMSPSHGSSLQDCALRRFPEILGGITSFFPILFNFDSLSSYQKK